MKLWQFFLTLASVVGITYVVSALLAIHLHRRGIVYPWNVAIVLLTMTVFVLLLLVLCMREERLANERKTP